MSREVLLSGPRQWKAVSHPLRHRIVRLLARKEMTNEELAKELGVPSGQLYYHTKRLLDAGLIELAGTRSKGPLTEKLYRKVGDSFIVPPVEDGSAPRGAHYIENALEGYRLTWAEHPTRDFPESAFHILKYLTPDVEKRIFERLADLMREIDDAGVSLTTPGAHLFSVAALAYRMQPEEIPPE